MHELQSKEINLSVEIQKLNYLNIKESGTGMVVTLVDKEGYEILKGYGKTVEDAINDLHHNLV